MIAGTMSFLSHLIGDRHIIKALKADRKRWGRI